MKIDGRCHCGYITFEAEADPDRTSICHCTDCQTLTGTPFRTSIPAPDSAFTILSGEPKIYVKSGDSGARRAQGFCPHCGSPIYATSVGEGPKVYNIRVGTLRQRYQLVPKRQVWCRSQQGWLGDLGSIPGVEGQS
ncbi:MAG: hypothetical protein QOG83_3536 [Alphaproteobacteria bacterium]|nr:hypothetical protein [Alphaproteobacteria bacterium]